MSKKNTKKELIEAAIKELTTMLKDPNEKIRLRAISLILRHSEKISAKEKKDPDKLLDWDFDVKPIDIKTIRYKDDKDK